MRKELFIHFSFWFFFFVLISVVRHYFAISDWGFWLGGILGVILPDIDHFIYVYFVKPQELTSQRINYLVSHKELLRSVSLLYETRDERKDLIFHTVFFQILFLILSFLLMTSSASMFGRGLALSFSLHLSIDQLIDLTNLKSFDNWLKYSPWYLDLQKAKIYWCVSIGLLIVFGLLL